MKDQVMSTHGSSSCTNNIQHFRPEVSIVFQGHVINSTPNSLHIPITYPHTKDFRKRSSRVEAFQCMPRRLSTQQALPKSATL